MLADIEQALEVAIEDKAKGRKNLAFQCLYPEWVPSHRNRLVLHDNGMPAGAMRMGIEEAIAYLQGQKHLLMFLLAIEAGND